MDFDIDIMDNPDASIVELDKRIKSGDAFLIWATGITKKREKQLLKIAKAGLKNKKTPLKLHIVTSEEIEFRILE